MKKRDGLYIELSTKEREMIKQLKVKYATNISQLIKNLIEEHYIKVSQISRVG